MSTVKLLRYPVYTLATDGRYIVTSGGGGGKEYGIRNFVEFHSISENDQGTDMNLESTASEGFNVLDCAEYVAEHNVWMGSTVEGTVFFTYHPDGGIRMLGRVLVAKSKQDPPQEIARLASTGDLFITGGRDGKVRVWKLTDRIISTFKESTTNEDSASVPSCLTDDYTPNEQLESYGSGYDGTILPTKARRSFDENQIASDSKPDTAKVEEAANATTTNEKIKENEEQVEIERDVADMLLQHSAHNKEINDCHLSPDGVLAASVCTDYLIMYKVDQGSMVCKRKSTMRFKFCRFINSACDKNTYSLITIEWEQKAKQAVATVWHYDLKDRKLRAHMITCIGCKPCSALCLSKDESYLGLGFGNGEVAVFKTNALKCISREQRHMLPVTDVAFLGDSLVSSGADFYVIIKKYRGDMLLYILTLLVPIIACIIYYYTHREY